MNLKRLALLFAVTVLLGVNNKARAHCEIPCGIFEDSLRYELIKEHIITIEKSMKKVDEFSNADDEDYHTITRWTINKEKHAEEIQHIVSQYFLHQRIKLTEKGTEHYEKYIRELTLLHELMVYAMKAKQSTDLKYIGMLQESLDAFADSYFNHKH